jgi:hypothetical protein
MAYNSVGQIVLKEVKARLPKPAKNPAAHRLYQDGWLNARRF